MKKPASDNKPSTIAIDSDESRGKERTTEVKTIDYAIPPLLQEQPDRSRLRVRVSENAGLPQLDANILLMEAIGTSDPDFMDGILSQLARVVGQGGKIDERELNFILSVVKGIKPKDQMEVMLAAQMAAVHMATMTLARRLRDVQNVEQQDSAAGAFNKLTRTYANQMEALKRYRTGGEQKVTVQHVSISEGGKAIVASVTQAAHETQRDKAAASPLALAPSQMPPMPIMGETAFATVPVKRELGK